MPFKQLVLKRSIILFKSLGLESLLIFFKVVSYACYLQKKALQKH